MTFDNADPAGAPALPPADDKDWTWVLAEACPECGFDAASLRREDLPARVRATAAGWPARLAAEDARDRPAPQVWSPLEYGCHVRDVLRLFAQRATLMLEQDDPRFANWDQDETAVADRYWEADPVLVGEQIVAGADGAAQVFARPQGADWDRPGIRSNGSAFTVESLGAYFLHDLVHHEWDVRR